MDFITQFENEEKYRNYLMKVDKNGEEFRKAIEEAKKETDKAKYQAMVKEISRNYMKKEKELNTWLETFLKENNCHTAEEIVSMMGEI